VVHGAQSRNCFLGVSPNMSRARLKPSASSSRVNSSNGPICGPWVDTVSVSKKTSLRGDLWLPWMACPQPPPMFWPMSWWNHWWISPGAGVKKREAPDVAVYRLVYCKAIVNHPNIYHKWVVNHQNIRWSIIPILTCACFVRPAKNQLRIEGSIFSCVRMKIHCELYPLCPIHPHLPLGIKLPNAFPSTFPNAGLTANDQRAYCIWNSSRIKIWQGPVES
jgi:hypothetical protein